MPKKAYHLRPSKANTADKKRIEREASKKYPRGSPEWKAYVFGPMNHRKSKGK